MSSCGSLSGISKDDSNSIASSLRSMLVPECIPQYTPGQISPCTIEHVLQLLRHLYVISACHPASKLNLIFLF